MPVHRGNGAGCLDLAVVVPTLNERPNIDPLLERLSRALEGLRWEVIFVDDDSKDGTAAFLLDICRKDPRVRFLRRVNRRGLSSACLEGMLSTAAPYMAVIDADLQHDESLLPKMLETIQSEQMDLVVGSRNLQPGGMGEFAAARVRLSHLGAFLGRLLPGAAQLSDPMSGFFMVDRAFLERVVHRTSGVGFKILLDLVASSTEPVRLRELPYRFGVRQHGDSKLDVTVNIDFLYLVADKLVGRWLPMRFLLFVLAGVPGLALHLGCLGLLMQFARLPFNPSNIAATILAMTLNFFVNNSLTYRDQRLRGVRLWRGLAIFYLACSVGALASFSIADFLYSHQVPWYLAGPFGMAVASVWNYAVTRTLAWRTASDHQAGTARSS